MKLVLNDVDQVSCGVWVGKANEGELRELAAVSGRKPEKMARSIVLLRNPDFNAQRRSLEVSINGLIPLILGETDEVLFVDQSAREPVSKKGESPKSGFEDFLEACQREDLPKEIIQEIQRVLQELAKKYVFTLSEGKARKWTATPNFLAISIQNTKKQFLISVKGNHQHMNYTNIRPKRGMADSYSEFHFASLEQVPEVTDVIRKSAKIQFGD